MGARGASSAASRNSAPCARRGRCVLLPARGGSAGGGGSSDACCSTTLLGGCWRAPAQPAGDEQTLLGWVLELAEAEQPSRLPLRA